MDLTTNKVETPLSYEIQQMWTQYSTKNIILDNDQMIYLNCKDEIIKIVSDYMHKILIEYIESEKNLNECYEIKNKYISNIDNVNNTSKYVKKLCDIIVNMDRVYKYVWNIAKLLNDDIESYDKFITWQNGKIDIEKSILDGWKFIYSVRNVIEHPENLKTTFFKKNELYVKTPKIILNNTEYDLLELGEKSLQYVFVLSRAIISAAFLYSKYVICFTDETRTRLYTTKPINNLFEKE
ncbi:MAG: hypothetical protein E7168_05450 [Firmicutes bacterium]|nr:hypothetical protein [Bacillota bacterium]